MADSPVFQGNSFFPKKWANEPKMTKIKWFWSSKVLDSTVISFFSEVGVKVHIINFVSAKSPYSEKVLVGHG